MYNFSTNIESPLMKYIVVIDYNGDAESIKDNGQAHHDWLNQFLQNGSLFAAGRRSGNAGSIWVMEAESSQSVEEIIKDDPFTSAGIVTSWKIFQLSNWSSKEFKGV